MKHDPGILEFYCYVCGGKIVENPVSLCNEIFRHKRCAPGSKKWLESEVGKKSPFYESYKKVKGERG